MPGRRSLEQTQESVAGLYEGAPTDPTGRPTGTRILYACVRAQLPLTHVRLGRRTGWYLTTLTPLHERWLPHLHVPPSFNTALANKASASRQIHAKPQ